MPRTHRSREFVRRQKGALLLLVIALCLPTLGLARGRIVYRCELTGEILPACCCELVAPVAAGAASCCVEPVAPAEESGCDCCDLLQEGDGPRSPMTLPPESESCDLTVAAFATARLTATGTTSPAPSARPFLRMRPPRRALQLLFSVFLR